MLEIQVLFCSQITVWELHINTADWLVWIYQDTIPGFEKYGLCLQKHSANWVIIAQNSADLEWKYSIIDQI